MTRDVDAYFRLSRLVTDEDAPARCGAEAGRFEGVYIDQTVRYPDGTSYSGPLRHQPHCTLPPRHDGDHEDEHLTRLKGEPVRWAAARKPGWMERTPERRGPSW